MNSWLHSDQHFKWAREREVGIEFGRDHRVAKHIDRIQ